MPRIDQGFFMQISINGKKENPSRAANKLHCAQLAAISGLGASQAEQLAALWSANDSWAIGGADAWQVEPTLLIEFALSCVVGSLWTLLPFAPRGEASFGHCSLSPDSTLITMLDTNPKGRSTTLFKALLGALLVGGTALTANSAQAVGWEPRHLRSGGQPAPNAS
ncbi:MAG: hypothetical protein WAM11_09140 [Cyanobium sp.]